MADTERMILQSHDIPEDPDYFVLSEKVILFRLATRIMGKRIRKKVRDEADRVIMVKVTKNGKTKKKVKRKTISARDLTNEDCWLLLALIEEKYNQILSSGGEIEGDNYVIDDFDEFLSEADENG